MIIELENISKSYGNGVDAPLRHVLVDISLKIESGESLAVVGPSGCGKSTLLNILGTLDQPTTGTVRIDGEDISTLNDTQRAGIRNRKIGFVFQMHHLLPQLNLIENVLLPTLILNDKSQRNAAHSRAMDLLHSVGLGDRVKQHPGQLSGGECQRAAVVRALINQPELILADEPTGSLDQESAEQIGNLLSKINIEQHVALVLVTHSMDLAGKMKTKYVLNQGKLK
ncbi:MAG: ABC transporter [Bacteroidetes bacterium HGW-Bacteroidetes-21]|jgi:ABC-type lipoprotein export system ATPase subunit|nr:MAG: ABC transporter [Bacteroidetes bacterium HGW-Bacteroidetes-21]